MQVRNAKSRDKDYKLADSDGLYLFVTAKGHRIWRMKYRFAGRERRLVLRAYPELSLREAHDRKADARLLLRLTRSRRWHGDGTPCRRVAGRRFMPGT
jgi:Arm DNA-binding domain